MYSLRCIVKWEVKNENNHLIYRKNFYILKKGGIVYDYQKATC